MNLNAAEDTFFKVKKSLNCRGKLLDLSTPKVMGIVNITPDSFHRESRFTDENSVMLHIEKMIGEGADIIDIGGQSTRPGAQRITAKEEWQRIEKILNTVVERFPDLIISVDTFYSEVAAKALDAGAAIINDISAGDFDHEMPDVIADKQVPYIIMHMQGRPENMQSDPVYKNVVQDVLDYMINKATELRNKNIHDIIIDPGFGFGKTLDHNYDLLKNLQLFEMLECPILAGLSRKSMVSKLFKIKTEETLNGTTALHTIALLKGTSILRVHDVKEAKQTIEIVLKIESGELSG
jgi:dihydropteroate synthase